MRITTLLLWGVLACSRAEPVPELPAPWSQMGLPVAGAVVDKAEEARLKVRYDDGSAQQLTSRWVRALRAQGYTVSDPVRIQSARIAEVERDGEAWVLGVVSRKGHVEVNLSRDDD